MSVIDMFHAQVFITCDFPDAGLWLSTHGSHRSVSFVSGSSSIVQKHWQLTANTGERYMFHLLIILAN